MSVLHIMIPVVCLLVAVVVGFFGRAIGRVWSHRIAILGIGASFVMSYIVYNDVHSGDSLNETLYVWAISGGVPFQIGFLIDELSAMMMVVVTLVSLMVHIYTVGYMAHDKGYQRFFSYISLFTFAMLMLVMSNNFVQLFFGWEAVGLISYLLIGFWHDRDSAIFANMKAFLVNRVGDFGFILGIAGVFYLFGSLDYVDVFAEASKHSGSVLSTPFGDWKWITVVCLLLFVGAMGKSAQMPLHVWLPDSMEGPTPISALIHAATMVTAGIFMVARMSPLYELSEVALSTIMVVGATTAVMMAFIGIVQNDIKRVVAFSTLSQLGYMTVALGASAYPVAIFHLGTHAFFKALLFLCAGSVIIAMHHEQDMRKMGGLRTIMPITYITALIGSLALVGMPPFAGFYSKDAIIESVHMSNLWGSSYAYFAVLGGVFLTALYSFRLLYMVFHGDNNSSESVRKNMAESPSVVTFPLLVLAVFSIFVGMVFFGPVISGNYFGQSITVFPEHNVVQELSQGYASSSNIHISLRAIWHGFQTAPFWLALGGVFTAWLFYCKFPHWPGSVAKAFPLTHRVLLNQYGFDALYRLIFIKGSLGLGRVLNRYIDQIVIDSTIVNGVAHVVGKISTSIRGIQTGLTYHYAFVMIVGLLLLITIFVWV